VDGVLRQAQRLELRGEETVTGQDDVVVVAAKLGHVLGNLLEPRGRNLALEAGGRQLDDPVAGRLKLVEQLLEPRVGDDCNAAGAGVGAQWMIASSRWSSSPGS
jgi:hypothetical protein